MSMIIDGMSAFFFFGRSIVIVAMPSFTSYRIKSAELLTSSPWVIFVLLLGFAAHVFSAHFEEPIHHFLWLARLEARVVLAGGGVERIVEARLRHFTDALLVELHRHRRLRRELFRGRDRSRKHFVSRHD